MYKIVVAGPIFLNSSSCLVNSTLYRESPILPLVLCMLILYNDHCFIQVFLSQRPNTMKKLVIMSIIASTASLISAQKLSPFGIGTGHARGNSLDGVKTWVPQLHAIDVEWYRTIPGAGWRDVEKNQGQWDFTQLDESIAHMDEIGMSFSLLLWGPGWKGDKGLPKNDIEGWSEYVRHLVSHCKSVGRTGLYYEIWNEPPNFTARGDTAADYAKLVAAAYDAAKAVDPDAKIGLTAKSVHINYLEHAIRHGAKDKFDWISLHPYETLNGVAANAGSDALFMAIVPTLRKMLKAQNPERADVPLIITEIGCDARKGEDTQADALIKTYTMGIAQGITQIQWFEARDGDSGPMGLMDQAGRKRPAYTAYGSMLKYFGQHPKYLGWFLPDGKNTAFAFESTDGKPLLVAWTAKKGDTSEIALNAQYTIVKPLTGETKETRSVILSNTPVFILAPPSEWLATARANRARPFPWNGDFSTAKEISISYAPDGKVIEKGLHTTSGEDIAKAVQLYGGGHEQEGARDGSAPGGTTFICDPNFLSYKTGPIEITVIARRKETTKAAVIDLEYEYDNPDDPSGIHPFTKMPREIPAGDDWQTLVWQLDDAEFNAYWGFNFRFGTGAYDLKSVSVRKR